MMTKHVPFWLQPDFDPWASSAVQPWWRKPLCRAYWPTTHR